MLVQQRYFIILSFFLQLSFACSGPKNKSIDGEISGKVIKVKDGDTIDILFNGKPLTIRLAHIDCPEKAQPFGVAAKKFISDKCFGKVVIIQNESNYDRNGRLIGVVINEKGEILNKEIIKAGLAWHFKQFSSDEQYAELENFARQKKVGLWFDENPVPPWEWRHK